MPKYPQVEFWKSVWDVHNFETGVCDGDLYFKSNDPFENVMNFYQQKLKEDGWNVTINYYYKPACSKSFIKDNIDLGVNYLDQTKDPWN